MSRLVRVCLGGMAYVASAGSLQSSEGSEVAQSSLTLFDPMDCSLPGSSVHGIFQAKVLEWVAISFSRGSFQPRDRTWVSYTAGRRFTMWVTREASAVKRKITGSTPWTVITGWQCPRSPTLYYERILSHTAWSTLGSCPGIRGDTEAPGG